MKIFVFGATGRTGRQIIKQALLERNFHVTAFARNPYGIHVQHPMLEIVMGDVLDEEKLTEALQGHEIILSALGFIDHSERLEAYNNIVNAMNTLQIKRLIAVGGMGALQADQSTLIVNTPAILKQFQGVSKAHVEVYKILEKSDLDFTLVCPPDIIDGEKTGNYIVKADYHPGGNSIFTGDLADFMLNEIYDNSFIKARVGISNS